MTNTPVDAGAMLALFQDHYWDSFENDKAVLMKHIEAVLRLAPSAPPTLTYADGIEAAAKVAEAMEQEFLDPRYASNQPFGSICERFACDYIAQAIRALVIGTSNAEN